MFNVLSPRTDARRPVTRLWIRSAEVRGQERHWENGNTTTTCYQPYLHHWLAYFQSCKASTGFVHGLNYFSLIFTENNIPCQSVIKKFPKDRVLYLIYHFLPFLKASCNRDEIAHIPIIVAVDNTRAVPVRPISTYCQVLSASASTSASALGSKREKKMERKLKV